MIIRVGKCYIPISNIVDVEIEDNAVVVNRIQGCFIRHEFENSHDMNLFLDEFSDLKGFFHSVGAIKELISEMVDHLDELNRSFNSVNANISYLTEK